MKALRERDHRTRVGRERSARMETRILETALAVFAAHGPDAPVIDDFVQAAGIARGTFYNHFKTVDELLEATSGWTTRETIESIERALTGIEGPTLRLGVGLRLLFARAQRDPVWSRFVAKAGRVGGLELPGRDIDAGIRIGHFRVPSREAARDVVFGAARVALERFGDGRPPARFGEHVSEMCLLALRADPRRIASALEHALPADAE